LRDSEIRDRLRRLAKSPIVTRTVVRFIKVPPPTDATSPVSEKAPPAPPAAPPTRGEPRLF
jgi:hypothetical protein